MLAVNWESILFVIWPFVCWLILGARFALAPKQYPVPRWLRPAIWSTLYLLLDPDLYGLECFLYRELGFDVPYLGAIPKYLTVILILWITVGSLLLTRKK